MRYYPTFDEFGELARGASVVPVYRQLVGDTLTPVTAFRKIQEGDWSFLFESVIGGATRDSYYSAPALFRYDLTGRKFLWGEREQEPRDKDNPFGNLRSRTLVMGDEVIFAPAYAAAVYAADKDTGRLKGRWTPSG